MIGDLPNDSTVKAKRIRLLLPAKLKQALAILHALPTHQLLLGLCHHESIHSLKFEKGNEDFSPAPHLIDFFLFSLLKVRFGVFVF